MRSALAAMCLAVLFSVAASATTPSCSPLSMSASQISDGRIAVVVTNSSQCSGNFTLYENRGSGDAWVISSSVGGNSSATHYIMAACYPTGTVQLKLETTGCGYLNDENVCALHPPERILPVRP